MEKRNLYWRKLDDQGKIYSLAVNKKDTSIFRLSVILKDEIEKEILQKALEITLEKYKVFKVKMRKGLFWHYFEENKKEPIISIENEYPFHKINTEENNSYLFKVTYFERKINIDFFHTLTDANNGTEFFKEMIYRYIEIKYNINGNYLYENQILKDTENSYIKNYKKNLTKSVSEPKAYLIKGEELENGKVGINHFTINLDELKKCAKNNESSISMYLVAMIAYSIYKTNYRIYDGKRPINICVPINLKKYFPSDTKSNFVSYMIVSLKLNYNQEYSFNEILNLVKKEFEIKLKLDKIVETMSSNGKIINNPFVRIVPLIIKRTLVVLGSLNVKRQFTTTFSNIGKIEIDDEYDKYIENFFVILAPDWAEKIRCGVCSYKSNLLVTFGTNLNSSSIEIEFKELLNSNNINFEIEGNEVNVITNN